MRIVAKLSCTLAGVLVFGSCAWAANVREIELRRLFQPTPAELQAEKAGRIYIYEGLRESDVDRAMTEEFDRLDSMMFVRMQRVAPKSDPAPQEQTSYYTQNDGC